MPQPTHRRSQRENDILRLQYTIDAEMPDDLDAAEQAAFLRRQAIARSTQAQLIRAEQEDDTGLPGVSGVGDKPDPDFAQKVALGGAAGAVLGGIIGGFAFEQPLAGGILGLLAGAGIGYATSEKPPPPPPVLETNVIDPVTKPIEQGYRGVTKDISDAANWGSRKIAEGYRAVFTDEDSPEETASKIKADAQARSQQAQAIRAQIDEAAEDDDTSHGLPGDDAFSYVGRRLHGAFRGTGYRIPPQGFANWRKPRTKAPTRYHRRTPFGTI